MPERLNLIDSIATSFAAQEPWPDNVKLYQPYEVEQILLPDNASSLAVQAFLKMCDLPFEIEMRWNAEFMSPSGRIPFIKCGPFVVSELEPIVQFCTNKGISLTSKLTNEQCAEMRAYMSLITNVLVNAELYISWLDKETYNEVTKPRNSSVYPWPLGWLQTRSKKSSVAKRLNALDWYNKTLDQVLSDVEHCCNSLSQQLGDRDFFFGTPNELDALIYGHIRALLSTDSTKSFLFMKPITTVLLMHTLRVANHTKMDMKPREMFLINQALESIHRPRAHSLAHSNYEMSMKRLSTHSSRLKHKPKSTRSDSGNFGFKPFATKEFMEQAHIETIQTAIERAINESQHHSDDSIKTLVEEKDDSIVNDEIEEEAVCVHKGKMNDCSSIGISDSVKNESLSDVVKISDLEMNEINDVSINYVSIDDFFNDHLVEKHFDPVGGDSF